MKHQETSTGCEDTQITAEELDGMTSGQECLEVEENLGFTDEEYWEIIRARQAEDEEEDGDEVFIQTPPEAPDRASSSDTRSEPPDLVNTESEDEEEILNPKFVGVPAHLELSSSDLSSEEEGESDQAFRDFLDYMGHGSLSEEGEQQENDEGSSSQVVVEYAKFAEPHQAEVMAPEPVWGSHAPDLGEAQHQVNPRVCNKPHDCIRLRRWINSRRTRGGEDRHDGHGRVEPGEQHRHRVKRSHRPRGMGLRENVLVVQQGTES